MLVRVGQHIVELSSAKAAHAGLNAQKEQQGL
jgi:hypothetical protein